MTLNNPGPGKFSIVLSATMVLIYLGLGFLFLGTSTWINQYPKPNRIYIGLILLGWALFRGFMLWQRYKKSKDENEI